MKSKNRQFAGPDKIRSKVSGLRETGMAGWAVCLWLAALAAGSGRAESSEVTAQLHVPSAEVHVIGDAIPLWWEFTNEGASPLGFLWEGCCRLNGRLDVLRNGQPLPPIPPGAALAHQFARAEILAPEESETFETLLSDWVRLRESGTYELQGRYVGVMPTQRPMVPPTLKLWRGEATTPGTTLQVVSPDDYLATRQARSQQRGLQLEISSTTSRFPAWGTLPVQVVLRNLTQEPLSLYWPGPVQLWLLNEEGLRVGIQFIDRPTEELILPGGGEETRSFEVGVDDLLDAPFGDYRLFVDYAAGEGEDEIRVPSNAIELSWQPSPQEVQALVERAAQGSSRGIRNPDLKRLRVYLLALRPLLDQLPMGEMNAKSAALGQELRLAACLKGYAPVPGLVDISLEPNPRENRWVLAESELLPCLPGQSSAEDLIANILSTRRHLGWSVQLILHPRDVTKLGNIRSVSERFQSMQEEMAGPLAARFVSSSGSVTNLVRFHQRFIPARVVLRLSGDEESGPAHVEAAHGETAVEQSTARKPLDEEALREARWTSLAGPETLEAWLTQGGFTRPQITVLADDALTWAALRQRLAPVLNRGWAIDLCWGPRRDMD